jgi:hypothetical protein
MPGRGHGAMRIPVESKVWELARRTGIDADTRPGFQRNPSLLCPPVEERKEWDAEEKSDDKPAGEWDGSTGWAGQGHAVLRCTKELFGFVLGKVPRYAAWTYMFWIQACFASFLNDGMWWKKLFRYDTTKYSVTSTRYSYGLFHIKNVWKSNTSSVH